MNGCNKNLIRKAAEEEIVGHNALAAGFQGQRQWTDFYPNGDFAEAMLNTSFDWNGAREPYILATENDVLNGLGMLFMKLLTGPCSDVRRCSYILERRCCKDELPAMILRALQKRATDSST